eukprot:Clim_evm2s119 gene=Clim_evmTU2s119
MGRKRRGIGSKGKDSGAGTPAEGSGANSHRERSVSPKGRHTTDVSTSTPIARPHTTSDSQLNSRYERYEYGGSFSPSKFDTEEQFDHGEEHWHKEPSIGEGSDSSEEAPLPAIPFNYNEEQTAEDDFEQQELYRRRSYDESFLQTYQQQDSDNSDSNEGQSDEQQYGHYTGRSSARKETYVVDDPQQKRPLSHRVWEEVSKGNVSDLGIVASSDADENSMPRLRSDDESVDSENSIIAEIRQNREAQWDNDDDTKAVHLQRMVTLPERIAENVWTGGDKVSPDRHIHGRVTTYCTANSYRSRALRWYLKDTYKRNERLSELKLPICYDEATYGVHVHDLFGTHGTETEYNKKGELFLFDYGVAVMWNLTKEEESEVLEELKRFEDEPLPEDEIEVEELEFKCHSSYRPSIRSDVIIMNDPNDSLFMLSLSYAMSQSAKLGVYEKRINREVERIEEAPVELANTGFVSMSQKDLGKWQGRLYQNFSEINLVSNVVDTPDFLWEISIDDLLIAYKASRAYYDLNKRVEVLNSRLDVLSEVVSVVSDQKHMQSNERLEWIVIILLVVSCLVATSEILMVEKILPHFRTRWNTPQTVSSVLDPTVVYDPIIAILEPTYGLDLNPDQAW